MTTARTNDNTLWNDLIERYFAAFLAFFLPQAHTEIDWTRGYAFLDKELHQLARDAALGNRLADKLVLVHLHDGEDVWVLIHVEDRNQDEAAFARRVFFAHARIVAFYHRRVVSLAILGDDNPDWRPARFGYQLWGSDVSFTFSTIKLRDYAAQRSDLEDNRNPFAVVVLAHLAAQETRSDTRERARRKVALTQRLYRLGLDRIAILELYRFIDWVLRLPIELEAQVWQQIKTFEETLHMPYITTAEHISRAEGLMKGIAAVLHVRFGTAAQPVLAEIQRITGVDMLEDLLAQSTTATTLDEVRRIYAPPLPDDA